MKFRVTFFVLVFSFIAFSPLIVGAAPASFFGPIIPDGTNGQPDCHCVGKAPGWGCILQTLQNVMSLGISLSVIIATLIIAYAGFLWILSPTNAENKQKGRTMLLNAVIGMVIVLSAWLVIDFFMKTLYDQTSFGPWNAILLDEGDGKQCIEAKSSGTVTTTTTTPSGGTVTATSSASTNYNNATNEAEVRARLSRAGISINHPACAVGSSGSGCTNVGGLKETTIQQIIALNAVCSGGCGMTVTGGSEPGHAAGANPATAYSHGNGFKVDLRLGTGMDSWIQNNLISVGQRVGDSGGPAWTDSCTKGLSAGSQNQYVQESDHWDIRFTSGCSY